MFGPAFWVTDALPFAEQEDRGLKQHGGPACIYCRPVALDVLQNRIEHGTGPFNGEVICEPRARHLGLSKPSEQDGS